MNATRTALIGSLISCALGGCAGSFAVEVENRSRRNVRVELVHNQSFDGDAVLDAVRVPSGGFAKLGPVRAPALDPVGVRASLGPSSYETPRLYEIQPGTSLVVIEDAGAESWEPIRVTVEAIDEPETEDPFSGN